MKRSAATCAAVLAAIGLGCGSDSNDLPLGGLGGVRFTTVGQRSITFVDASRPTKANGSYPGAPTRTLPSLVWYPAEASAAGADVEDIPCLGGIATSHRGDPSRCTVEQDAAFDSSGAPYPLIVFSHGFGNGASATTYFSRAIASYGYIVVAPDFPLSSRNTPGGPTVADLPDQAGDVAFLASVFLGEVDGVDAPFPGAVDGARLGAAGRSLGGSTTLFVTHNAKYRDPRFRAAAAVSPGWDVQTAVYGHDGYFEGISTPLLIIGGSDDTTAPFPTNDQPPYDLANPPKFLVELFGEGHTPETEGSNTALVAFFEAFLRGRLDVLAALDGIPEARVEEEE